MCEEPDVTRYRAWLTAGFHCLSLWEGHVGRRVLSKGYGTRNAVKLFNWGFK